MPETRGNGHNASSRGNSGPPRGKRGRGRGRPPHAGQARAGPSPSRPEVVSQAPAPKRRLGAYTKLLLDPVTFDSLSDHTGNFLFRNGLASNWVRRASQEEHDQAVELFLDTLPMEMAFRFQTHWDKAGGSTFTEMLDLVNEEIEEREEASEAGVEYRPFLSEAWYGMTFPKLQQPVTWRTLLDQYENFIKRFDIDASEHRDIYDDGSVVDNFLCTLPLNLRRRFREKIEMTGWCKWTDMISIIECEVEDLRELPPDSLARPRPPPSRHSTGASQPPPATREPVDNQRRLGAWTELLHDPITLNSLSDHVHEFVFNNGLQEHWCNLATVEEHERAVELFLDTLPGETAFQFQTEWDHIGGRTFIHMIDVVNEEIAKYEEAEEAGVEYIPPVSAGRKWMFPRVMAPNIAEGLFTHLAGHACAPGYDYDEPQDERTRAVEEWARKNQNVILPLIDEFLFPLPVDMRRRFRREWEKRGVLTFRAMEKIAKSELKRLQKKAAAANDAQAAASPTVETTGIAIVTSAEQPTTSRAAKPKPQKQARNGEAQRQRKAPSPPRDTSPQSSLAASMNGLAISNPPAPTRQSAAPAQEPAPQSQEVHTGTGTRPSGSTTFFVTNVGTHSVVKDRGLLINVKRLAVPALLSHVYLTPDPEHMLYARHVGTLLFRRPGGPIDISIPNVYFCPDGEFNILGHDAVSPDGLRFDEDSVVFHHTGLRFPLNANGLISFDLPHHGPGVHRPTMLREDTAYMLSVGKYEWVDGQLVHAA